MPTNTPHLPTRAQLYTAIEEQTIELTTELTSLTERLGPLAKHEDVASLSSRIESLAKRDDLEEQVGPLAKSRELSSLATKEDLASLAMKADLASLVTREDLASLATKADLQSFRMWVMRGVIAVLLLLVGLLWTNLS